VLDAGVGVGRVAVYMAKHGLRRKDVDVEERHVERERKHVRSQHVSDRAEVFEMNYERLTFESGSFDRVYHDGDADA
jgi:2-polyprenyl-3-methyl-5-hydroxy-6-metoxy-1,4-benzoquinol methylase